MIRRLLLVLLFVTTTMLLVASTCRAEPMRIVLSVGHRNGFPTDPPLKHSARDATRVRDLFVQLGGSRPEHALTLLEPTKARLFATIDTLAAMARSRNEREVSVLFYFSGHGDRDALHLGSERIPLRELETKLGTIPSALRIMVTDACRTMDLRGKGVSSSDPFAITLDREPSASGVIRLHASADGEIAQESDELGAAVFTHYWLTGLAGAADNNGDARVTFSEAYAFAYSQTLFRSARASGVVQRPAMDANVSEGAPIVLTRTWSTTRLVVPRTADTHYVIYGVGTRSVAGELWSSPARNIALAVPPGRYIVHRRASGRTAAAQIDVGKNEERELRGSDFQAVPEEVLARKGGEVVLHPNELGFGYSVRTGRLYDVGHELNLRWEYASDFFAFGVGALGGIGSQTASGQEATLRWLGAEAIAELRTQLGGVMLRAGAGPRVVGLTQSIVLAEADRLARAGYDPERRFRGYAIGAHALAGVRIPLGARLWIDVDARGEVLGLRLAESTVGSWSAGAGATLGVAF
jgi:hypothetical protein